MSQLTVRCSNKVGELKHLTQTRPEFANVIQLQDERSDGMHYLIS